MLILNQYQNCIYRCILSRFKVSCWLKISILGHLMLFSFSAPLWWYYVIILEEYSRIWACFSSHLDFANDWKAFLTPNLSSVVQQKSFPLSILVSKHKESLWALLNVWLKVWWILLCQVEFFNVCCRLMFNLSKMSVELVLFRSLRLFCSDLGFCTSSPKSALDVTAWLGLSGLFSLLPFLERWSL